MLHQFADMLSNQSSSGGGPLNWDLAKDIARHQIAEKGDPSVLDAQRRAVVEALRLADLWLDEVTTHPAGIRTPQAWSRSEWIEHTLPVWSKVCDPMAARMVESMGSAMPEEMQAVAGPLVGMVRQMAGAMVGGQAGQALGALALEVVGSTDIGLPLAPAGVGALLPSGVREFGEGLEVEEDEVRVYLALREAAHQRLFEHVPWLRPHLLRAVEDYASGITVDLSKIEDAVSGHRPEQPRGAAGGARRRAVPHAGRDAAAEGGAGPAGDHARAGRGLGGHRRERRGQGPAASAVKLAEAVRRRRATGGPAERTFATLVGLELRPRRLREAAALWASLGEARGTDGRDAVWAHPDLMPTAEDLDDPTAFVEGKSADIDITDFTDPQGEDGKPDDEA